MINRTNNKVTFDIDEYDELLETLDHYSQYQNDTSLEMAYVYHFIRYYNLKKLYEDFKANPPEDDEDDEPFLSYKRYN